MNGQPTAATLQVDTSAEPRPSIPNRLGERALLAQHWKPQGVLPAIQDQGRFARRRGGPYEGNDFVVRRRGMPGAGSGRTRRLRQAPPIQGRGRLVSRELVPGAAS